MHTQAWTWPFNRQSWPATDLGHGVTFYWPEVVEAGVWMAAVGVVIWLMVWWANRK